MVLRLGGELDGEGAAAVARLIGQSMGDLSIDFTDVRRVEGSQLRRPVAGHPSLPVQAGRPGPRTAGRQASRRAERGRGPSKPRGLYR